MEANARAPLLGQTNPIIADIDAEHIASGGGDNIETDGAGARLGMSRHIRQRFHHNTVRRKLDSRRKGRQRFRRLHQNAK